MILSPTRTDSLHFCKNILCVFNQYADIEAEGLFRIQPDPNNLETLENELLDFEQETDSFMQQVSELYSNQPQLFDTYVLSNLVLKSFQNGSILPLQTHDSELNINYLSHWSILISKLRIIHEYFDQGQNTEELAQAINQVFDVFMSELLKGEGKEYIRTLSQLLLVCQNVILNANHNKMNTQAVAHQFSACFMSVLNLDSLFQTEQTTAAKWQFCGKILEVILKEHDFTQPLTELFKQDGSQVFLKKHKSTIQKRLSEVPGLKKWLLGGKTLQIAKALTYLVKPSSLNREHSSSSEAETPDHSSEYNSTFTQDYDLKRRKSAKTKNNSQKPGKHKKSKKLNQL